jgi:hypothetical protein
MKKWALVALFVSTCLGCSTKVQLIQEMNHLETKNKIQKNIELCVNTDAIPEPYVKNPTSYTAGGHDFIFELRNSLANKTEYGFNRVFSRVDKCNGNGGTDYQVEVNYSNTDLSFACSYASGKFDEAVFNTDILLTLNDKKKEGNRISKKKNVSATIRHKNAGGDMLLTNQAIDKALGDFFDFLTTDADILKYFNSNLVGDKDIGDRLKNLERLYQNKLISEEEYNNMRNKILKEI